MRTKLKEILIAEDSKTQAIQIKHLLECNNYNVTVCSDGKQAVMRLKKNKPDLVISDILMPEINGYDLCRNIKSNKDTAHIPVMLLTRLNDPEEIIEGLSCGADSFITKPYDEEYLLSHIEKLLCDKTEPDQKVPFGTQILFNGRKRIIQAEQQNVIKLMLNIYEGAIQQNEKLIQTQQELQSINSRLESIVEERTIDLSEEIKLSNEIAHNLKESEDKFKYVFDHSVIGKSITFPSGEIHVNKSFCEMLGYSQMELEQVKWQEISHHDDVNLTERELQNMISGKMDSIRLIKRYLHKNGSIIWTDLSTSLRRDSFGNPMYFITSVIDITERKVSEQLLIESERMLRESQEIAHLGTYEWNLISGSWRSSEILDAIFGIDNQFEKTMTGWVNIVHPEWQKIMNDYIVNDVFGKHKKFNKEYKIIRHNDGSERWVHGMGALEFESSGNPIRLKGTITDITERKIAEEALRESYEELDQRVTERTANLEAANKELEAFSYSVSHDLRAPLRAVHSFTKILLEDYRNILDDEGKRICDIISSSATKMGELIDDLLSFSRIGRSDLNPSVINMQKMAGEIFEGVTSPAERGRINLKLGKLQKSYGDVKLIGQVWTNLISNAIKYTSKNTTAEILIGSSVSDKMVTYFIKDNGVGFDMQYAHKLFGVFQRLHSESEFEGNGVGLAIVQRIILKHRGKVWAEGKVEKGAIFYFSMPIGEVKSK